MIFIYVVLCESMRLYLFVLVDSKEVMDNDVLLNGLLVKKGIRVIYYFYVMGRVEKIWGLYWVEYRLERWLEGEENENGGDKRWKFVVRDSYSYSVF